jgi:hypothetical protein
MDLRFPLITNEEPRKELRWKLEHLVRASRARLPPYTWDSDVEFARLVKLILAELKSLEAEKMG